MNISIVISLYNEAAGVSSFHQALTTELAKIRDCNFTIIWVNDGSTDNTQGIINGFLSRELPSNVRHTTIEFSRNFGHEAAMIAGIDHSAGDAVICMDSDGQHPPDRIASMVDNFRSGSDIVLMERLHSADASMIKKGLSRFFYRMINSMSEIRFAENSSDFFLVSARVVKILKSEYRDRNRFIRGFIQSLGFEVSVLPYHAPARMHGETNYSFWKRLKLAINSIFAFSNKPLWLSIFISILFAVFTFGFGLSILLKYIRHDTIPSDLTLMALFMSLSFTLVFMTVTILSIFFEKAIQEMRQRPIYIIKSKRSADGEAKDGRLSHTA